MEYAISFLIAIIVILFLLYRKPVDPLNSFGYHGKRIFATWEFIEAEYKKTLLSADELSYNILFRDILTPKITSFAKEENLFATALANGRDYYSVVLRFILFELKSQLLSGQYHFYRGYLNDEGQQMFRLLKYVSAKLVQGGYEKAEEKEEFIRSIQQELKELG